MKGPFTVWVNYGCYEGWKPTDYPTLEAALKHEGYGNEKHISRPVKYRVIEEGSTK